MGKESRGGAAAEQTKFTGKKSTRAKITSAPDRDFSKGREAAALKIRLREVKIDENQAGLLREYTTLMDALDDAQKISTKGSAEQRKAALANIKEIAELVRENRKDLKATNLDVGTLGLDRKDNRKFFMRERKDLFEPTIKVIPTGKALESPVQHNVSEQGAKDKAAHADKLRQSATKNRDSAEARTNRLHDNLMKIRRDLKKAQESGSADDVERLTRTEADTKKAYAAGRAKIKTAEQSLKAIGIDPSTVKRESQQKDEREERAMAAEALEMDSDPEEVLGFLAAPDDIKGAPSPEFHKLTDADFDNVGKRETEPATAPTANEDEESLEDISDTLEEGEDEADRPTVIVPKQGFFSRVASFDVGQAARQAYQKAKKWGGLLFGVAAIAGAGAALESRTVDDHAKEPTSDSVPKDNLDMASAPAANQEALPKANVYVDDANVEISQPPANAPTEAKDGRVTLETWQQAVKKAAEQMKIDADSTDAQLVALGFTSQELRAGALRHNLRAFKAGNELIADMMRIDASTGNVRKPENLLGALKIIRDTPLPDKRTYEKELRAASSEELKENLAAMKERHEALKSISSSESPVLQQMKMSELKAELQRHKEFLDLIKSIKDMKIPDDNSWSNAELAQEVDLNVSK